MTNKPKNINKHTNNKLKTNIEKINAINTINDNLVSKRLKEKRDEHNSLKEVKHETIIPKHVVHAHPNGINSFKLTTSENNNVANPWPEDSTSLESKKKQCSTLMPYVIALLVSSVVMLCFAYYLSTKF